MVTLAGPDLSITEDLICNLAVVLENVDKLEKQFPEISREVESVLHNVSIDVVSNISFLLYYCVSGLL